VCVCVCDVPNGGAPAGVAAIGYASDVADKGVGGNARPDAQNTTLGSWVFDATRSTTADGAGVGGNAESDAQNTTLGSAGPAWVFDAT